MKLKYYLSSPRLWSCIRLAIFITLTLLLFLIPHASAWTWNATITGTTPPAAGNWTISNYTSVINGWVEADNGENISILSSGTLHILGNTTIQFNQSTNFSNNITVYSGGNLTIDSQNGKDNYIQNNNSYLLSDSIFLKFGSIASFKNVTFVRLKEVNINGVNVSVDNVTLYTNISVSTTGVNGFHISSPVEGIYTLNINNSIIFGVSEAIVTETNSRAVMNVRNSTIGQTGKYTGYAITHPYTNSLIEYNKLVNIDVTKYGLYIDRNITVQNNDCSGSQSTYNREFLLNGIKNTWTNNTLCAINIADNKNSNSIINSTINLSTIYIEEANPNLAIQDVGFNKSGMYGIYTKSNLTVRNITFGTQTTYRYKIQTVASNLTIVNETGTTPTGASVHYIMVDGAYIIKRSYLFLNIIDSLGNQIVAQINATDKSGIIQNLTNASHITLELPKIIYSKSNGVNDVINKSDSDFENYTITITNSSYSGSPYIASLNMTSNQILNVNLGSLLGGDTTAPTYSGASHNQTTAGQLTNFSLIVNDETALQPNGQCIIGTNNTGSWVNSSPVNFTQTPGTCSLITTLNSTSGITVGYRFWMNDSAGNYNETPIYSFVTNTSSIAYLNYPYNYTDNNSDNSLNNSFFSNATSGTGTINETNHSIEMNLSAKSDAAFVATQNSYKVYNLTINITWSDIINGNAGIYIQDVVPAIGTNAYVTSKQKCGVSPFANSGRLSIVCYNTSSGGVYWNETSQKWDSNSTSGVGYVNSSGYNISIQRDNIYIKFMVSNSTGILLNSSRWLVSNIRNGTNADYIVLGDMNNQLGRMNASFRNFSLNYSDGVVPVGNNYTTDLDAQLRLDDEICYPCNNLTTSESYYHYATFNSTKVGGLETGFWVNNVLDPDNISFVFNVYTENGSERVSISGIPINASSFSNSQPFLLVGNNSNGNFSMSGTYPIFRLYSNGTSEKSKKISMNLTYNMLKDHWYEVGSYYTVVMSNISGNVTVNGTLYELTGYGSWEHAWGETNMGYPTSGSTGEAYIVFKVNELDEGATIYTRFNDNGVYITNDGAMTVNGGYNVLNVNYTAWNRTANGTQYIITDFNMTSFNSTSGANITFNASLINQYGIERAATGALNSARGLFNITGVYTYPNGTTKPFSGKATAYNKVEINTTNPIWKWTNCTYGCQNTSNIQITSNQIRANWTAFNETYLIQNVYFNITYPNSSQHNDISASLLSGSTQNGIWYYDLGSAPAGDYTITTWANDSRGVWIRQPTNTTLAETPTEYIPPTPINLTSMNGTTHVNWTWEAGTGNITTSYNVSINGTWFNNSPAFFNHSGLTWQAWSNITACSFNSTGNGSLNQTCVSGQFQLPAAPSGDITSPNSISSLTNTTGNFYHNWSWTNPSDGDFNYTMIYINGSFIQNQSSNFYNLTAITPRNMSIISTHTVDTSGNINQTWINHTSQIKNNAPIISNASDKTANENESIYIDINAADIDSDTLIFSNNRTDLFVDFNNSDGTGNWTINYSSAGTYVINFGVSDGFTNTNVTMIITIINIPLNITSTVPTTPVTSTTGYAQTFTADSNRTANYTWYINGASVQTNNSVSTASYTNNTTAIGIFNLTLSITDGIDTNSTMWTWNVTSQPTYSVSGYIFDNNGAGLNGASVVNGSNSSNSNSIGYYSIPGMSNGTWNFTVSKTGFDTGFLEVSINGAHMVNQNKTIYDNTPPSQVTGLTNDTPTASTINISWSSVSGTNYYQIFRNSTSLGYTQNTFYNDSNLEENHLYNYSVRANDTYNNWGANSTVLEVTTTVTTLNVVTYSPSNTNFSSVINESQSFNFTVNMVSNFSWYLNGTLIQSNASLTVANYTNTTSSVGLHNVTVTAINGSSLVSKQWNWSVTSADTDPPNSVTNLSSTAASATITWTWTNPQDTDFSRTMVYIDGQFKTNTTGTLYESNGLNPLTEYTISTRTVDTSGNINQTWVNNTAKTTQGSGTSGGGGGGGYYQPPTPTPTPLIFTTPTPAIKAADGRNATATITVEGKFTYTFMQQAIELGIYEFAGTTCKEAEITIRRSGNVIYVASSCAISDLRIDFLVPNGSWISRGKVFLSEQQAIASTEDGKYNLIRIYPAYLGEFNIREAKVQREGSLGSKLKELSDAIKLKAIVFVEAVEKMKVLILAKLNNLT